MSDPLPDALLIQIGRIATTWALIEHDIRFSVIAMRHKLGHPKKSADPEIAFSRIRKTWYDLATQFYPPEDAKVLDGLNEQLMLAAEARGFAIHGMWHMHGPESFTVYWFRDAAELIRYDLAATLSEALTQADRTTVLLRHLRRFLKPEDNAAYLRHVGILK
jgi:hypothetical protein